MSGGGAQRPRSGYLNKEMSGDNRPTVKLCPTGKAGLCGNAAKAALNRCAWSRLGETGKAPALPSIRAPSATVLQRFKRWLLGIFLPARPLRALLGQENSCGAAAKWRRF
jgi:hypothetical protein